MSFDTDVSGLDDVTKHLDELGANISKDAITGCFKNVVLATKDFCPDAMIEFIPGEGGEDVGSISVKDRANLPCLLKALDKVILQAPEPTQSMLKHYRSQVESDLNALDTT